MITRAESGLTDAQYAALLANPEQISFEIEAQRINLDFSELATDTSVTGNLDVDFAVAQTDTTIYRLVDYTLEAFDGTSWTLLATFTPPGTPYAHTPAIAVRGSEIHVWVLCIEGLYENISTDGGATWSGFSLIYTGSPIYYRYTSDLTTNDDSRISASSQLSDRWYKDNYAFDGTSNFWAANGSTGWIRYQFPTATAISRYTIRARGSEEWVKQGPKSWTLQSSPDGSTWTTIHTVSNEPIFMPGERRVYTVTPLSSGLPSYDARVYWRLNFTANQGDAVLSVGEIEFMETVSDPKPGVSAVAAVSVDRLHLAVHDSATLLNRLVCLQFNGSTWDEIQSDIWWPFEFTSFQAIALPDADLIAAVSNVPGTQTDFVEDGAVQRYIFTSGGIVAFRYANETWSDHYNIDVVDDVRDWRYRANLRLMKLNGQVYATFYSSDGTETYPIEGYRIASTADGRFWSAGEFLPLPDTVGGYGLALAQLGDTLYGLERAAVYESLATVAVNAVPDDARFDLTPYVNDYTLSHDGAMQIGLLLDNSTGIFDNHPIMNPANNLRLVLRISFRAKAMLTANAAVVVGSDPVVVGSDPVVVAYQYLPDDDDPNLTYDKITLQTGLAIVDTFDRNRQLPESTVRVTARDLLALMTDITESDQAYYWQSHVMAADDYVDGGTTPYGGLSHTAVATGSFKTNAESLEVNVDNEEAIAFSTLLTNLWNGAFQTGFQLEPGGTGQYAGIVFRAIDTSNMLYVVYEQASDRIRLYRRHAGVDIQLEQSSTMSWASNLNVIRYLRVVFRYGKISVYSSTASSASADDGGDVWTHQFTHYTDVSEREYGLPYLKRISATLPERGSVGVIGKGKL